STFFANFESAWFGSNVPSNFVIGAYGGSGVGLSATADGVNLFDSAGNSITGVSFGASTAGHTFDNAAGLTGAIATASEVGTNGAFTSQTTNEVGSPGRIAAPAATPEPASLALLSLGGLTMLRRRRAK
ncbi:MAG: PEP-CTERM sorting domain-containing protein, partial [Tepidisphaeraceae bacterium]